MIGSNVRDILREDFRVSEWFSIFVVLFLPLFFYFLGFQNFLSAVGFTGGVFLALEGIFIVAMWRKAFPENKWRWISWPLYGIFLIAFFYAINSYAF